MGSEIRRNEKQTHFSVSRLGLSLSRTLLDDDDDDLAEWPLDLSGELLFLNFLCSLSWPFDDGFLWCSSFTSYLLLEECECFLCLIASSKLFDLDLDRCDLFLVWYSLLLAAWCRDLWWRSESLDFVLYLLLDFWSIVFFFCFFI